MLSTCFYASTPIIDAEDLILEKTEAMIGQGRPTTGSQYRLETEEFNKIATELRQARRIAALWGGPAGAAFVVEMETYCGFANQMAVTHWVVANILDAQAAAVLATREALEDIEFKLVAEKIKAQGASLSGNLPASLKIQRAAAQQAAYRRTVVIRKISGITMDHAAQVDKCREKMAVVATTLSSDASLISLADRTVAVNTAALTSMASSLGHCAGELTGLLYSWPWIINDVRLTHGNAITAAFNDALATFERARDVVLNVAEDKISTRATDLTDASSMYTECDQNWSWTLGQQL